jgi:hypothetical protein
MAKAVNKKSSKAVAQLAAKVLHGGYWPSKAETKTLAASVVAQAEREASKPKRSTKRKRPTI